MATSTSTPVNTISGKVVVKETGVGIPDVLVAIYDLDPGQRPEEEISNHNLSIHGGDTNGTLPFLGDMLVRKATNENGEWSFSYENAEFRVSNPDEKRPDLQLMVLGPEDADSNEPPVVLFNSKLLVRDAPLIVDYRIRIASDQLIKAGIPVPSSTQGKEVITIESKISKHENKGTERRKLKEGIKKVNKEFDEQDREEKKAFRETIRTAILPNAESQSLMYNFISGTKPIRDVQYEVFDKGTVKINDVIMPPTTPDPRKGIKIHLILTEEEKGDLVNYKKIIGGNVYYDIPPAEIERLLFKRETDGGINSILFSNNPISKYCIQKTIVDKCAELHTGITEENGNHHHNNGTSGSNGSTTNDTLTTQPEPTGLANDDIPFLLEKILAKKNSDQFHKSEDYSSSRPDDKSVQDRVDNFALQKGPADTTAYYDFHSLQIAFEHVWQQLFDETLVNLSEKVNTELEESGKPGLMTQVNRLISGVRNPNIHDLITATENTPSFSPDEVPTEISAAFDISLVEYNALTGDNKERLWDLAKEINFYESKGNNPIWASSMRDQGERIIDNLRINKPFTTNQLLKELQERLLSKYEFTVFAADKDYHSINFGVLNTFRQKWEPISYQAGKLVKTIPLSPKEERKYSVKTVQNVKTTRKEAKKNNSTLHNEMNTISRAESEIIGKARDKSNFSMSVKLDYATVDTETAFGKEAEKDSSQTKKDFRESVIKASQEYKEERAIEIDTEQTMNSEYNESGTIVNPNDELSVTYLFYELQRRYRISEQLYRVMPVVLVAQQVPSPDQITEAWIIAHDWIINRVLLDDSFRSILQYLAQKNVGDDYAVRELRRNMREQRRLVKNLQVEFSKLQREVDYRYAALQKATDKKIGEIENDRFFDRHLWIFRPTVLIDPPNPEMAKAYEQAAQDEHKYAVEKAEKVAMAMQREINTLRELTSEYNNAMREHLDRITQTRRLITHVKNNILYYMQAIWSMEPPDQRYMRLYKVKVPTFEATKHLFIEDKTVPPGQLDMEDVFAGFRNRTTGEVRYTAWLQGDLKRKEEDNTADIVYKQLVEVADLDTVLGFKGNYMIFPLKEHNPLTEFMAAPYIDQAFGAMDPDQLSNINLEEFSKYICCLHDEAPNEYERLKPVLKHWLGKLLADPVRNGDEIVIPTGSLFIEMLPSTKTLLENFKLLHREWDVFKVQAEVRKLELENIRYAARLLEDEREDPDIEKKIVVEHGEDVHLDVEN